MPNLEAPPFYIKDVSDPVWKKWFSRLHQELIGIETGTGTGGISLPSGGTVGQILSKTSSGETYAWIDSPIGIPDGGVTDQYLFKVTDADYDVAWGDAVVTSSLILIDGGDAPLTDPQSSSIDGGLSDSTYLEIIDGGLA